jgi:hypothetical protein
MVLDALILSADILISIHSTGPYLQNRPRFFQLIPLLVLHKPSLRGQPRPLIFFFLTILDALVDTKANPDDHHCHIKVEPEVEDSLPQLGLPGFFQAAAGQILVAEIKDETGLWEE